MTLFIRWGAIAGLALALLSCGRAPLAPRCGDCAGGELCEVATGRCVAPAPADGGGCLSEASCGGATPRCQVETGRCVACLGDGDCVSGTCDLAQFTCTPLPDSCSSRTHVLDLSSGSIVVTADSARAVDDTRLSCALAGSVGPDVVYALAIPSESRLVVRVVPLPGSPLHPVVGLRSACDSQDSERALGCAFPVGGKPEASLVVDALAAGTWYLWIDSDSGEGGAFRLEARLESASKVDSCQAPGRVEVRDGPLELSGDSAQLVDDTAGTCGGLRAPDAVYALNLDRPRRLHIEAVGGKGFGPVLYLRDQCSVADASAQVACTAGGAAGAVIDLPRLEAGTWFLFVDGQELGARSGRYRVLLTPAEPGPAPANDTCAAPEVLALPAGGLGRITAHGDTSLAIDDPHACGGRGADVVYALTLIQPTQVSVRAVAPSGSNLSPIVALLRPGACSSQAAAEVSACASPGQAGTAASFVVPRVEAGTWFLWVDGAGPAAGAFDLEVELTAPPVAPTNDTCAAPGLLSLGAGPVTVTGTTLGAADDVTTCGAGHSPDVVYSLVVPTRQSVAIEVRAATGSGLHPAVAMFRDPFCSHASASVASVCSPGDALMGDRAVMIVPDVQPGTLMLWVDGVLGTQGAFSLRASSGPVIPPPPNDTCVSVGVPGLSPGVLELGDTRGASDDAEAGCGLAFGANGEFAPDVAFTFQVHATGTVTFTVTPDPVEGQLFRPVLSVRGPHLSACSALAPSKGCAVGPDYGRPVSLTLPSLAPGSYTLWVDGVGLSSGRFTVLMQ